MATRPSRPNLSTAIIAVATTIGTVVVFGFAAGFVDGGFHEQARLFGAALGFIGILVSTLIAWRQDGIARRTHELTEGLSAAKELNHRVEGFFRGADFEAGVPCILPVFPGDPRKPLPLVNNGDAFVANVLNRFLGNSIRQVLIERDKPPQESSLRGYKIDEAALKQAPFIILVCSPIANRYLDGIVPTVDMRSQRNAPPPHGLPIWFAIGDWEYLRLRTQTEVFGVVPTDEAVSADDVYDECQKHSSYQPPKLVEDQGLLARVKLGGKTYLVIAGLHQYGTYVVGEVLHRLLEFGPRGEDAEAAKSLFDSDDEFILRYTGQFNHQNWSVDHDSIKYKTGWRRKAQGEWETMPRISVRWRNLRPLRH